MTAPTAQQVAESAHQLHTRIDLLVVQVATLEQRVAELEAKA